MKSILRIKLFLILSLVMVSLITSCGGPVKIDETTITHKVCTDYSEPHETIVDVTNLEFTDAATGASLVDGNFLVFHRSNSLKSETWEIFGSLNDADLFAFKTSLDLEGLTSATSTTGFSHRLYRVDESYSFADLMTCMESTAGSVYDDCSDVFPAEYDFYAFSHTIEPVSENTFRFEGRYGYYQGDDVHIYCFHNCSKYENSLPFIGFDISFDLIADDVDLKIGYPNFTQTCHIITYEYECAFHSSSDYSCPEGYEKTTQESGTEDNCEEAKLYCTKCSIEDEDGTVVLDGEAAAELVDETRGSICQGTKNENWDTLIDLIKKMNL